MRNSDQLFQLIKSLSKTEKRYFKLFASMQGGEKKYLTLFDAIASQDVYDEGEIKEHFSNEKFIRQFNVAKKYLYDLILKSLRVYHSGSSDAPDPREIVKSAEILFKKGLHRQAARQIEKAAELAEKYEDFNVLDETTSWQYVLDASVRASREGIEAFHLRHLAIMEKRKNMEEYSWLLDTIALSFRQGPPRSAESYDTLDRMIQHPLLQSEEMALSTKARILYNWCHSSYCYSRGDYRESIRYLDNQIAIFDSHSHFKLEHPTKYIAILNNRLYLSGLLSDNDEVERTAEQLRAAAHMLLESRIIKGAQLRSDIFSAIYLNHLLHHIGTGEFERGVEMVGAIEEGLQRYGDLLPAATTMKFHHALAQLYFGLGDLRRALDYNNRVLDTPEPDRDKQNWYAARLLELIIHFELGNNDFLEYRIRSTYRWLRSHKEIHRFEEILLDFFRKLPKIDSEARLIETLGELRDRLTPLDDDPFEGNAFRYFHYLPWLESRIEGTRYAECVRAWYQRDLRWREVA
jgi:hypothetical protein